VRVSQAEGRKGGIIVGHAIAGELVGRMVSIQDRGTVTVLVSRKQITLHGTAGGVITTSIVDSS
jgi:anaerobic glycerol-3-phosphate dehydrogenase